MLEQEGSTKERAQLIFRGTPDFSDMPPEEVAERLFDEFISGDTEHSDEELEKIFIDYSKELDLDKDTAEKVFQEIKIQFD